MKITAQRPIARCVVCYRQQIHESCREKSPLANCCFRPQVWRRMRRRENWVNLKKTNKRASTMTSLIKTAGLKLRNRSQKRHRAKSTKMSDYWKRLHRGNSTTNGLSTKIMRCRLLQFLSEGRPEEQIYIEGRVQKFQIISTWWPSRWHWPSST